MKKTVLTLVIAIAFCSFISSKGANEVNSVGKTGGFNPERTLVVYFSATNNTEKIAEKISKAIGCEIFEINAKVPYTNSDLDWHDSSSRTTLEMNDESARPEMSSTLKNIDDYDVIFLGYPIWWGEAPRIMRTFLESGDFSGKTIIPFCTSSSSGIGQSDVHLAQSAKGATWKKGKRFSSGSSQSEIDSWISSIGL